MKIMEVYSYLPLIFLNGHKLIGNHHEVNSSGDEDVTLIFEHNHTLTFTITKEYPIRLDDRSVGIVEKDNKNEHDAEEKLH